jgi:sulfoxide reductase heme-binding subunit YedZ
VTTVHLFWITSRAAGIAALLLSSVSVGAGLTMSMRLVRRRTGDLRVLHEALSLATIVAIAVHAVTLLGDSFMHPSVADLALPWSSGYRQPWMAIGIVAGWSLAFLGLSYYLRRRIGIERWRRWHRFTALAWVASIVHSLGEGTDAGTAWFFASLALVALPAGALLVSRRLPRARAAAERATP